MLTLMAEGFFLIASTDASVQGQSLTMVTPYRPLLSAFSFCLAVNRKPTRMHARAELMVSEVFRINDHNWFNHRLNCLSR
jgi:hypothetical protein